VVTSTAGGFSFEEFILEVLHEETCSGSLLNIPDFVRRERKIRIPRWSVAETWGIIRTSVLQPDKELYNYKE